MVTPGRAKDRRPSIINAARSAFGQYGYTATTVASVAQRAGVSEATVFREFGTKETLFDAAVLTPFSEFTTRHLAEWRHRDPGSLPAVEEAERLINRLIDLFNEERAVVVPLLAAYHSDDASSKLRRRLEEAMRSVVTLLEKRMVGEAQMRRYDGFDIAPLARIIVGVCFSLVTFPGFFDMARIPRSRIVQEMSRLTVHGVEFRSSSFQAETAADNTDLESTTGRPHSGTRSPSHVDDRAWELIAPMVRPLCPPRRSGRHPIDDRLALEGIVDVLSTGTPWRELPTDRYGISGVTCWRRLKAWQDNGIWPAIAEVLHDRGVAISPLPISQSR